MRVMITNWIWLAQVRGFYLCFVFVFASQGVYYSIAKLVVWPRLSIRFFEMSIGYGRNAS